MPKIVTLSHKLLEFGSEQIKKFTFFFSKKRRQNLDDKPKPKTRKGRITAFFSRLAKAFLLPIAILPIAGIFLGIGATIGTNSDPGTSLRIFGDVLTKIGSIAFSNIAILFAIAIAIAFTNYAGVAALACIFGYLVFNAFISAFLTPITGVLNGQEDQVVGWRIWFWNNLPRRTGTSVLGLNSFGTGVIGAITVGFLTAFVYNKFKKLKLPAIIGFFAGERSVAIIMMPVAIVLAVIFIIVWPAISVVLNLIGTGTSKLPIGLDSFIEGIGARALIPFGLHHIFYGTLWWTEAGGALINVQNQVVINHAVEVAQQANLSDTIITNLQSINSTLTDQPLLAAVTTAFGANSQQAQEVNTWFTSISANNPNFWNTVGDQFIQQAIFANPVLKIQEIQAAGLNPGRFISGGFPLFMFCLPLIGYAMWTTVPKANRKLAFSIYGPAALTAFLTGVTEPIEFSFLFAAPWLYYGIYVPLAGLSWMLMNVAGASISVTFSQGFLDYIIYGILPFFNGHNTRFWVVPLIGLGIGISAFFIFRYLIIWRNVDVPGRKLSAAGGFKLTTKADFINARESEREKEHQEQAPPKVRISKDDLLSEQIVAGFGGWSNIISMDSCATRLRFEVKDPKLINKDQLMATGAFGVVPVGTNIQVIYGPKVIMILNNIKDYKEKDNPQNGN